MAQSDVENKIYVSHNGNFALALIDNEILTFQIFDFEKVCQGRRLELSQWRHLMANLKIYKSRMTRFGASSRRSEDTNI